MTPLDIDMACIPAIIEMQQNGIRINPDHFARITQEFTNEADHIQAEIEQEYGKHVNVRSNGCDGQLSKMLVEMKIYARPLPVDKKTLAKHIAHPIIRKVQLVKHLEYLKSNFTHKMPKMADSNWRIHTDLLLTRTTSGRFASKNPNQQNIPTRTKHGKLIRCGFIPADGCVLVSIDYAGIEMRYCAHKAHDKKMIESIYKNDYESGDDLHTITAKEMFDLESITKQERGAGKETNFKIVYGTTEYGLYDGFIVAGLVDSEGQPLYDLDDCKAFIQSWQHTWPDSYRYMQALHSFIEMNGYVENAYGFRRDMSMVYSHDKRLVDKAMREGGNMPIQSDAAANMKIAIPLALDVCHRWEEADIRCKMLMTIHDELLFEIDQNYWEIIAQELREVMEGAVDLSIATPCDIEQGLTWGNMEEIELN
ncbi:MAG: hypothetical protein KAS32_27605 [Candidatus Peribacteraceae bacterium]|nr:hypothetical protein [Candidatus Peribacteraceae bacterium]